MSIISKYNDRFNKYVIKLINIAESTGSIDSSIILSVKQKIKQLNDINPLMIIQLLGKYLYDNDEYITNKDEKFLVSFTDKEYLKKKILEYDIPHNRSDIDFVYNIVSSVYGDWTKYDEDQKNIIFKIFQIMLSEYCKYLNHTT